MLGLFYPVPATTVVGYILMQILCVVSQKSLSFWGTSPDFQSSFMSPIILWDRCPWVLKRFYSLQLLNCIAVVIRVYWIGWAELIADLHQNSFFSEIAKILKCCDMLHSTIPCHSCSFMFIWIIECICSLLWHLSNVCHIAIFAVLLNILAPSAKLPEGLYILQIFFLYFFFYLL